MDQVTKPLNDRPDEISAAEAARLLEVKLPTLYAYVSRGLLRSLPGGGRGRARRYLRSDVEALRRRARGTAAGALRWGEPVLDSAITEMTARGPSYRGRLARDLSEAGASFEAVAELLWNGTLPAEPPHWEPERAPNFRAVAKLLPAAASRASVAQTLVAVRAAADTQRFDTGRDAVLPRARDIARLLACALALPQYPERAVAAWSAATVAGAVLFACGLKPKPATLAAVDTALVQMADHELNASTFAARITASTHADVYAAVLAGLSALSGPLHGAVSDQVEALLVEVARPEDAERVISERARRGERLPGFGHPFYKQAGDPRCLVMLEHAWSLAGRSREVERINAIVRAAEHAKRPPPNVDLGIVALRAALGMQPGTSAGLFAIGRSAGWVAHIVEQYEGGHLLRPRARYTGPPLQE